MLTKFREENDWQTLHVEGNRLLNKRGEEVRLLGVNCAGLEWMSRCPELLETVVVACDDWKANIIRLPMSQDRWFGFGKEKKGSDESGESYRKLVDEIVEAIASRKNM